MRAELGVLAVALVAGTAAADTAADAASTASTAAATTAAPKPNPAPTAAPAVNAAAAPASTAADADLLEFLGEFSSEKGFQDPFVLDAAVNSKAADALDKAVRVSAKKEDDHGG